MMVVAFAAGFAMAFLGSMPPVGPIAVLLLERGMSGRAREGIRIGWGAALAETMYCALATAGVSELMQRYAIVETIARVVSVVILVVLGVYFVRFRVKPATARVDDKKRRPFALGFSISAANPTLIITWSGSVAMVLAFAHARFDAAHRVLFVAGVLCGMLAWFHLFLWMLARWRDRITLRAAQWTIRIAGATMLVLALWDLVHALLDRHA